MKTELTIAEKSTLDFLLIEKIVSLGLEIKQYTDRLNGGCKDVNETQTVSTILKHLKKQIKNIKSIQNKNK